MTRVERIAEGCWQELRDLRVAALTDAPFAFASTLARESGYDEGRWRAFLGAGSWFVARDDGRAVGLVALLPEPDRADERHLVSMWVAQECRGRGVAGALLSAALSSAAGDGARRVVLWVADGNSRARRFYERAGFRPTGDRQPLPSEPARGEEKLSLALAQAGGTP